MKIWELLGADGNSIRTRMIIMLFTSHESSRVLVRSLKLQVQSSNFRGVIWYIIGSNQGFSVLEIDVRLMDYEKDLPTRESVPFAVFYST